MPARLVTISGRKSSASRPRAGYFFCQALLVLAATLLIASCNNQTQGKQQAAGGSKAPPPPEVEVVTVKPQNVPLTRDLVGRLASSRVAEVRARVAGIILKQVYTEGTDVKAGQVLFKIDPAPLQVKVHGQQAELAKARADAEIARQVAQRYTDLNARGLTSRQDLDNALAKESSTAAAVKIAEANLEAAELDLDYSTVRATIDGRAGRAQVNEGALVGQGEATVLTTVEQIDPIRVNFSQSLAELQQLRQMVGATVGNGPEQKAPVDLYLPDGKLYPHQGGLDFTDLAVDPGTGSVSLRAVVPNPERQLLPGMFVKLRLTMGQLENAYLVPQVSVLRDAQGAYVLIVDQGGSVRQKRIELQTKTSSDWVVSGELQDGDRVITAGLQKVLPGAQARVAKADTGSGAAAGSGKAQN